MSDARTRALEREGDTPEALSARLRDGSLTRDRLELAAYCGHAGAREAAGIYPCGCPVGTDELLACLGVRPANLNDWLRGLERWPGALELASLAANVERFKLMPKGGSRYGVWLSIDAHSAWLINPSGRTWYVWIDAHGAADPDGNWLAAPYDIVAADHRDRVERCVEGTGEQPVREAIQAALIEWALQ